MLCAMMMKTGAGSNHPDRNCQSVFDQVQAGGKRYFEIPNAAHYVLSEAPGVVLVDLVQYVRPVAK